MTLQQASPRLVCAWLYLATLIAATEPPQLHEARQGPITVEPLTSAPGPVSVRTSSSTSTTPTRTTMSPTSSSKPSLSSSSSDSPFPSTVSNTPMYSSSSPGTLASSGTSSATPQPSSSPGSLYFTVQNLTTCTSGLISWNYTGKEAAQLFLSITNIGVPQYGEKNTFNTTVDQQLADTNTSAQPWTWNPVNLPQGWYEIDGLVLSKPSVNSSSSPFFIANGTDVSCLIVTPPQASSTTSPSATTSTAPNSNVNIGGIVGGVVGGITGLILLMVIGMVCLSRRRKRSAVGCGRKRDRQWGSLKSNTSSIQTGGGDSGAQFAGNHFHGHSESTGAILQDGAGGSRRVSATTVPGSSEEEEHIVVNEEKLGSPASSGMSPFDALNTPLHHDRCTSTHSTQIPTAVSIENFRSRVPSTRTSSQTLEQQAQRIRSSMETSNRRRSVRLSIPGLPSPALAHSPTHAQPKEEYPLTPVTPTPVNRTISAGAVSMTARRTSRKPVPQYDSSLLLEDKNADSVSTHTAGAESSQSHGTGVHGTPSDLVHKASFGDGRPMHYLIPDMPSPQLD